MKITKKNHYRTIFCLAVLLACTTIPAVTSALEPDPASPVHFALAVMLQGQTKTFVVESNFFPNMMIVPVALYGSGTLRVSVSKTDSAGDIIAIVEEGGGHPEFNYVVGITPCNISISSRFWDYGTGIVVSSLLFTLDEGPYSYSLTLAY
jgi:hypothetical protein